jgi:hypothetical protein
VIIAMVCNEIICYTCKNNPGYRPCQYGYMVITTDLKMRS